MKTYLYLIIFALFCSCSKSESTTGVTNNSSNTGIGGSLARFAIVGNYLYTVTNSNFKVFDITNESSPNYLSDSQIGIGIETIFPLGNTLFLGSQNGMYIYDITNPLAPIKQSLYIHVRSCDPVVANEKFAYVTLNTGSVACSRGVNQLEIIDISNKTAPASVRVYPLIKPGGLALGGNDLFVCDDVVKWYDTTNSPNIVLKGTINISANDAIIVGKTLMLVGNKGLTQYDFSGATPKLLSEIVIGK
jgi:hypothetical protein